MSHEGGPESTQQRTVAELLAMYGGDQGGERAPRRRRRRDDPAETGPQAIIERVNSESAKFAPIRDDQPPPTRTSHRQRPVSHHQPPAEPRSAEPRPAQPRPAEPRPEPRPVEPRPAQPPRSAAPPPRQAPPKPAPVRQPPPPAAPPPDARPTSQLPVISQSAEPTRPVPPQPRRVRRPEPPSGAFPAVDPGPHGSGYPPAPPVAPRNGTVPEAATEQLPKISGPPPGRNSTGQHPVPFPPTRTGFAPVPASFGPDQRNGIATPQQERFPDDYANTGLEGLDDLDEDRPLEDYPGYPDSDDEPDAYPDSYPDEDVDDEDAPSPGREWLIMAGQVAVSVVGGAAVWLGFNWLWGRFPQAALVAALAVIVGLVWIVRKIRRADDLQTTGLAVLVGLFVTVSPAALLLLSR